VTRIDRYTRGKIVSAARHGVVGRSALAEIGLTRGQIDGLVRDATLWPLFAGTYAVGRPDVSRQGRWLAAVLASGEGAVLSHLDAAMLLDLRPAGGTRVHVSVPRCGTQRAAGLVIHVTRTLTVDDVTELDGIPCTTAERAMLDCADVLRRSELERMAETGYRRRAFRTLHLHRQLAVRGRRLRKLARALRVEPRSTRSPLEDDFLDRAARAGLPKPLVNTWLPEHSIEVDVMWPERGLAVEIDSSFHDTPHAAERDAHKDAVLERLGYTVIRVRQPGFDALIHRLADTI
jgi:very-short-patch-repair endonuclease